MNSRRTTLAIFTIFTLLSSFLAPSIASAELLGDLLNPVTNLVSDLLGGPDPAAEGGSQTTPGAQATPEASIEVDVQTTPDDQPSSGDPNGAGGENTGTTPGYGGYANGNNIQASPPLVGGTSDAGLSTGGINSGGAIVADDPETPQDESQATVAGVVEALGIHGLLGLEDSLGSAGSSSPPSTGIIGSVQDLTLPGIGTVSIAPYETVSTEDSNYNDLTVLLVSVEALDLNLVIPLGQSSSNTAKAEDKITSDSDSSLLSTSVPAPGQGGDDLLGVDLLGAESHSEADGASAGTNSEWTLIDLEFAGIPVVAIDSASGASLAGATLLPISSGNSLLIVEPIPGVFGVALGETWAETDGETYAYGGANALRLSLLDSDDFLILGHAGTGANATFSDGPGAGPDQENEGHGNLPPSMVNPPNDRPIVALEDDPCNDTGVDSNDDPGVESSDDPGVDPSADPEDDSNCDQGSDPSGDPDGDPGVDPSGDPDDGPGEVAAPPSGNNPSHSIIPEVIRESLPLTGSQLLLMLAFLLATLCTRPALRLLRDIRGRRS